MSYLGDAKGRRIVGNDALGRPCVLKRGKLHLARRPFRYVDSTPTVAYAPYPVQFARPTPQPTLVVTQAYPVAQIVYVQPPPPQIVLINGYPVLVQRRM